MWGRASRSVLATAFEKLFDERPSTDRQYKEKTSLWRGSMRTLIYFLASLCFV